MKHSSVKAASTVPLAECASEREEGLESSRLLPRMNGGPLALLAPLMWNGGGVAGGKK